MLRNKEHTSTITEMPDEAHLIFCVLCLSSPVEWSPKTYAPYGGDCSTLNKRKETYHLDNAYFNRGPAGLVQKSPRL